MDLIKCLERRREVPVLRAIYIMFVQIDRNFSFGYCRLCPLGRLVYEENWLLLSLFHRFVDLYILVSESELKVQEINSDSIETHRMCYFYSICPSTYAVNSSPELPFLSKNDFYFFSLSMCAFVRYRSLIHIFFALIIINLFQIRNHWSTKQCNNNR